MASNCNDRIIKVIELVCAGATEEEIALYSKEKGKWGVTRETLVEYIEQARKIIAQCAHVESEYVLGEALTRLNGLYKRALLIQDHKTALAVQREINHLLGLDQVAKKMPEADLFFRSDHGCLD